MPNENCVTHRATELEFKDFPKTAVTLYDEYSYNCGAVKVIPPMKMLTNDELLSETLLGAAHPLHETYEKKTEGVYKCDNVIKTTPVNMPNFVTRNVKPSMKKSGGCTYNDQERPFWNSAHKLYEKTLFFSPPFKKIVNSLLLLGEDHGPTRPTLWKMYRERLADPKLKEEFRMKMDVPSCFQERNESLNNPEVPTSRVAFRMDISLEESFVIIHYVS